jgi:two-component system, OmpR family, manganese sensing response regulator
VQHYTFGNRACYHELVRLPENQLRRLFMAKILLIDDDLNLAENLSLWLCAQGDTVERVETGDDGLQMLSNYTYDVGIIDWMLPGLSGPEICSSFRRAGGVTPIILLTAQASIDHIEKGLKSGADDYLIKPFQFRELFARTRSLMRRPAALVPTGLTVAGVTLDPQQRSMVIADKTFHLMPKESALLEYLMRHPNRACSAQALLEAVWPSDTSASVETIRTWMRNLRQKLSEAGKEGLIKTVPAAGYMIEHESKPAT